MPTLEDRLAALEQKVASLELRRLYDESKAEEGTPSEQSRNLRAINENMTILVGVVGRQGQDIKAVRTDLNVVKERVEHIDHRLDGVDRRLEGIDQSFKQILQQLVVITAKLD